MKLPTNFTRLVPLAVWLVVWSGLACLICVLSATHLKIALFTSGLPRWPNAIAASGILIVSAVQLNGARVEAVFWVTGCLTYFIPIGLFAHGASILLASHGRSHCRMRQALGLSVVVSAASCSESVTLTVLILLFVSLVLHFVELRAIGRDPTVWWVIATAAFVTVVFCAVAFAPGHTVRKAREGFVGIPVWKSLFVGMNFTTEQLMRFAVRPSAGLAIFSFGLAAGLTIRHEIFAEPKAAFTLLGCSVTLSLRAGHTMALVGTGQPMIYRAFTACYLLFAARILSVGLTVGQWVAAGRIVRVRWQGFAVPILVVALVLSRPVFNRTSNHLSQLRSNEAASITARLNPRIPINRLYMSQFYTDLSLGSMPVNFAPASTRMHRHFVVADLGY